MVSDWNGCAMRFLPTLLSLLLSCSLALADGVRILVQSSPLAGSQYYGLAESWREMKVDDVLTLIREPENKHDRHAIRVEWRGRKLGYVPRAQNRVVAQAMDEGERLVARISRLSEDTNPWRRVEFEVYIEL